MFEGLLTNPVDPSFSGIYDRYLNYYAQQFPGVTADEIQKATQTAGLAGQMGSGSNPYMAAYQTAINLAANRGQDPAAWQQSNPFDQGTVDAEAAAAVGRSPEGVARAQDKGYGIGDLATLAALGAGAYFGAPYLAELGAGEAAGAGLGFTPAPAEIGLSEAAGLQYFPEAAGAVAGAAPAIEPGLMQAGADVTAPTVTASGEPLADVGKTIAETSADLGYTPAPTDVGLSEQAGLQYFPQAAGTAAGAGGLAAALKSYAPLISALTGVGGLGLGAYQASKAGQQGRQAAAQIAQLPSAQRLPAIAQQAEQAATTAAQTGQLPPGQQAQYQQLSRDAVERAKALSRRAGIADSSTATALQTQAETAATNAQQAALQNYINQQTSLALSALTGSNTPLMAAIQAQMTADANSAALMQRYFATGGQLLTSAMSPTYYPYGYPPAATPIQ
jgi:hypothetical protein